jgi:hypothetical protein
MSIRRACWVHIANYASNKHVHPYPLTALHSYLISWKFSQIGKVMGFTPISSCTDFLGDFHAVFASLFVHMPIINFKKKFKSLLLGFC